LNSILLKNKILHKKITLLIFSLFLLINTGIAQESALLDVKKWTVRSIVFTQPYTFERKNPLPSFFTGIGGKLNYERISYRASFEHINYINELESRFQKGYIKENTLRLGAEYKMKYYEIINLNFFLDASITKLNQEATAFNLDSNLNILENYDGYGVGAIFGIGFDYFVTPNFSLSLETRMDLINISGDYSKVDYINKYTVNYVATNNKLNLNLLGNFSINYHF